MNDPHVNALIYHVVHDESVSYRHAHPITCEMEVFLIKLEDGKVRFELKEHYATEDEARNVIEPYIKVWEFDAGLRGRPGNFGLTFDRAEVIDRCPTPGATDLSASTTFPPMTGRAHVITDKQYPMPPSNVTLNPDDPDLLTMYNRLQGYFQRKEYLASMSYFCLNLLENSIPKEHSPNKYRSSKARKESAKRYDIDLTVLDKIGELTANRGGDFARKALGIKSDLTKSEHRFLEEAVKMMIRRMAEVAYNPCRDLNKITLPDLPSLD